MAKLSIQAGSTSVTLNIFIQDTRSTVGLGLTGLAYNTAGLTAYYGLHAAASAVHTLNTQTVTGAFSQGGFVEIDNSKMKGWYRLDLQNAAIASGRYTTIHLQGAANMADCPIEIELTATNNQSTGGGLSNASVNVTQINGQAASASGTVTFPNATLASTTNITAGTISTVTTVTNQLTAAAIATGVWQDATSGDFTTASSIGKCLYIANVVPGGTNGHFIAGTNAATAITTGLTAHLIGTVDTCTTVTNQLTAAAIATGVWTDTTAGDFTTSVSIGKSIMNGVALGTGLKINSYNGNTAQTGDSFALIGTAGVGLTNIGTIATCTNLTNAPTSGDFTATMKTSIGTAVAASAVASVTAGVNATKINGSTTAATNLALAANLMITGTAVTGTLSSTVFTTNLASTTVGAYIGRVVLFTGGALIGQAQTISAYSATGQITVSSAFTGAPSNTDAFEIV